MDLGPSFRKFRAVAFSTCILARMLRDSQVLTRFGFAFTACITVVSLVWAALACLILYMHWGDGDNTQCESWFVMPCGW